MEQITGLTPETAAVFDRISRLESIKPLWLCGGTSISLQLGHRLSEDLDFELLGTRRERPELNFNEILKEVRACFPDLTYEHLGNDQFQMFLPNRVKLSFFRPSNPVPTLTEGLKINNIRTPSLQESLGMKIFVANVRNVFRDYYDIYCLLQNGGNLEEGITYASKFSRHQLHTKQMLTNLLTPELYFKETDFDERLCPAFNVSPKDIQRYMMEKIAECGPQIKSKFDIGRYEAAEETRMLLQNFGISEGNIKELIETGSTIINCPINVREKRAYDTDIPTQDVNVRLEYRGLAVNVMDPISGKNLGSLDKYMSTLKERPSDLSKARQELDRQLQETQEQKHGQERK